MPIWSYTRGPDLVDIKVGYRCNNACVHCVVDPVRRRIADEGEQENLTTKQVEAFIDDAAASSAKAVVLTGGEVTIRPDFLRLVRHASARNLRVIIQTNGRALSRPQTHEWLAAIPGLLFVVALHGSTPEIHDRITRRRGSYEETTTAIRQLRAARLEVAAKVVLSKLNLHQALRTAEVAHGLGVNEFCVAFPHALDFPQEQFERVVPRYSQVANDIHAVCRYAVLEDFPTTFETVPYCVLRDVPALWKRSCDLQSFRAPRLVAPGQRLSSRASFDWEDLRPIMKRKEPSCRTCVFDQICEGPWREYVDTYGFDEFEPVRPESVAAFLASAEAANPPDPAEQTS